MIKTSRPWTAYLLRGLCCMLLFLSGYVLLLGSTFAMRLRNDLPVHAIVILLSIVLAFFPLFLGRSYFGGLLVSAFILSGIGGYWWTSIPWDELIKDSGFPTSQAPRFLDHALVASPAVVAAFYAVVSRPSALHADLKNRGADLDEVRRASVASFFSGAILLLVCGGLSVALWALLASGLPFRASAPIPRGVPALVIVGALVTVAYALLARRIPLLDRPPRPAPEPSRQRGGGWIDRILAWRRAQA